MTEVRARPSLPVRMPGVRPYALLASTIVLVVLALIVVPIGRMILRVFTVDGRLSLAPAIATLQEGWVPDVLVNTIGVVAISTVLALVVGAAIAWVNERTDAHLGVPGVILPILPLLIPSVALAIGWAFIGAPRVGFANGLIAAVPGLGPDGLALGIDIYSWPGLVWLYTLSGVPYVYLIVSAALRNLDPALEEASRMNGAGLFRTLRRVSLPAIRPALFSAALLVAISGFAHYSLPAIIATAARIDILSVQVVRLLRNTYPPRLDQAVVLSLVTLAIVGTIWAVQHRIAGGRRFVSLGGRASSVARVSLGPWRPAVRTVIVLYLACASIVPLVALVIVAFQPFWTPKIAWSMLTLENFSAVLFENRLTQSAFGNSIRLSLIGATIATAIAVTTSIYAARNTGSLARAADGLIKAPATISALVISVGFLVTFAGPPLYLGGTLLILQMAFIVIYMPPASIAADSAVRQVGNDLWEASHLSGAGDWRTIRRVVLPLVVPGLAAGWSIVFVHMMGDLSASALLSGVGSPVIGYAILEIWENSAFPVLAAFSTLMCVAITVIVAVVIGLSRWYAGRWH